LAYVFDYINNTLIDDEDKSLGNKLAVLDSDLEKVLQELNERFGPGTIQEGTQGIPQPEIKIPQAIFEFEERMKGRMADGGMIGGGIISGEDYGDRTGFANIFLEQGKKSRFGPGTDTIVIDGKEYRRISKPGDPNFGKYVFRQSVSTGKRDSKGRIISKEIQQYFTEEELRARIKEGSRTGKAAFKSFTPEYLQSLEDIKAYVKAQGGAKKVFLSDLVAMFGDPTATETGRDAKTESRIEKALGEDYKKLIKGGDRKKITNAEKIKFNKLVREVNRGDRPLIDLSSDKTGISPLRMKDLLNPVELKMYEKLSPKFRTILTRVVQPRKIYTADDIKNISETTVKTYNKTLKDYPVSTAARTEILKAGTRSFDAKSYILAQLARHVDMGGKLFKYVSGNTVANVKFKDLNTGKFITYRNIDLNDPLFKEAATVYNDIEKLKKIKIDDPLNPGKTINLNKALQEGGDKLVIDHLDEVDVNPLKKLVISTQKANVSGQIKGLTEAEINAIGRGLNLNFVDNLKRYKKYAERILLNKASNPEFKIKSPTETIKEKTGTFKGEAQNIKSKMDNLKFLTNKIPGGAVVLSPVDFTLSMFAGLPLKESLASAGSYLIKDPFLGKAVNVPLAIAADIQDPEGMMERAGKRQEKFKNVLEGITGIDQDEPLLDELREKFSNMEAGDQPDIDPFQAAEGGRAGFSNGGAAGADENFLKELEFYFTNEDAELPKMQTYKETMNPIEVLNDIIDPRNYPYYADVLARSGLRIGEFALRILPATGKLISDIVQKGPFRITGGSGNNYVQDYDEVLPSNIRGTGIFSEFLQNITPTSLEKKIGLDKLIKAEEQKQIERGSTAGAKVFADTIGLGAEVTAPIFPGLKLLNSFAKARNLPVNNVTKKLLIKEVDEVLEQRGMNRREFLQATGAGATVILAKLLGFGDEIAQTAKVAEKVAEKATSGGVPPYFFQLVEKIKRSGKQLDAEFDPRVENNMQFEDYVMKENMATGEITIQKIKEDGMSVGDDVIEGVVSDELITYKPGENVLGKDGKYYRTADEYEESTVKPDSEGKMKDYEDGLDSIEEIIELLPNKLKMSELEAAGYNVDAFPDNIKQLLINDIKKID